MPPLFSPSQPRNPHGYFPHVLLILLAEPGEEQAFFVTRDVMQETDGADPHTSGCHRHAEHQQAEVEQDLAEVDRMAYVTEHALSDYRGIFPFPAEYDVKPGSCEEAG